MLSLKAPPKPVKCCLCGHLGEVGEMVVLKRDGGIAHDVCRANRRITGTLTIRMRRIRKPRVVLDLTAETWKQFEHPFRLTEEEEARRWLGS